MFRGEHPPTKYNPLELQKEAKLSISADIKSNDGIYGK